MEQVFTNPEHDTNEPLSEKTEEQVKEDQGKYKGKHKEPYEEGRKVEESTTPPLSLREEEELLIYKTIEMSLREENKLDHQGASGSMGSGELETSGEEGLVLDQLESAVYLMKRSKDQQVQDKGTQPLIKYKIKKRYNTPVDRGGWLQPSYLCYRE
ncbi:hypothetical protein PPACK8108_LOCUS18023 [Phakopsora pachyrhizi]|uniref:Uncharacterized protein n=1 Tax=Phakopsora pachyrhizi TaxID=170000 RepID=A0AAV0BFB3_PHAPC|nr:hypothetical protein PPACK8108_LOCUS18023 [Phakopsora pachyrhizi]